MPRLWLKVEPAILEHPKTVALAELYGVHPYTICGFLVAWWGYCAHYEVACPESKVQQFAEPVLRLASEMAVPDINEALTQVGFMGPDRLPNDWEDYTGGLLERRAKDRRRQDKRRGRIARGSFTADDWRELLELCRHSCAYCGAARARLGQDHVQSLSQGGVHSAGNILPCCRVCNSRKGKQSLAESGLTLRPEIVAAIKDTRFAIPGLRPNGVQAREEKSRDREDLSHEKNESLSLGIETGSPEAKTGSVQTLPARRGNSLKSVEGHLRQAAAAANGRLNRRDARRLAAELFFQYWCARLRHPTAMLDEKRERVMVKALQANHDDGSKMLYVIDGAAADAWTNQELGRHDITVLYRDQSHIEKFLTSPAFQRGETHPLWIDFVKSLRAEGESE